MEKIQIDKLENVLSEQREMQGLFKALRDILNETRSLWAKYDRLEDIPAKTVASVVYQLMRDDVSVNAILHYLQKTNDETISNLDEQVHRYYHNEE